MTVFLGEALIGVFLPTKINCVIVIDRKQFILFRELFVVLVKQSSNNVFLIIKIYF